jgi:hypothetical protein
MIYSMKMNVFGKISDERNQILPSDPVCIAAVKFASTILQKYCTGEIEKRDINPLKTRMLKDIAKSTCIAPEARRVAKRPAAAPQSQPAKKVKEEIVECGEVPHPGDVAFEGEETSEEEEKEVDDEQSQPDSEEPEDSECGGLPSDWVMPAMPEPMHEQLARFFA